MYSYLILAIWNVSGTYNRDLMLKCDKLFSRAIRKNGISANHRFIKLIRRKILVDSRILPSKRFHEGMKNTRNRRNRQARVQSVQTRELLDKTFQKYLSSLTNPPSQQDPPATSVTETKQLQPTNHSRIHVRYLAIVNTSSSLSNAIIVRWYYKVSSI